MFQLLQSLAHWFGGQPLPAPTPAPAPAPTPAPGPAPRPAASPAAAPAPAAMPIAAALARRIHRAVDNVVQLDRIYGMGVFTPASAPADWKHDLVVMAEHRDLRCLVLELLGAGDAVLCEYLVALDAPAGGNGDLDAMVLPVVDRTRVAKHRLIIRRRNHDLPYRSRLRINWGEAATASRRGGSAFGGGHDAAGRFHVDPAERHELVVTRELWDRGFAFGDDCRSEHRGVYLHAEHTAAGFRPRPGQKVTCILVTTSRGLQGRDIRPA